MSNVLVIGDLHEPFSLDKYLDHCCDVYNRFECDRVVFIGDVLDNHYSSYHETDPDGLSGGDELDFAIDRLSVWRDTFPQADVTIGNHDRLVARKAFSSGIPARWVRRYSDVLGAPGWRFTDETVIDGVVYCHGEGGTARRKSVKEQCSVVQGHLHNQAYIEYNVGRKTRIFGMQVGCGIDRKSYAMAYGKAGPKPAISCGVVIDRGTLPILCMMDLK